MVNRLGKLNDVNARLNMAFMTFVALRILVCISSGRDHLFEVQSIADLSVSAFISFIFIHRARRSWIFSVLRYILVWLSFTGFLVFALDFAALVSVKDVLISFTNLILAGIVTYMMWNRELASVVIRQPSPESELKEIFEECEVGSSNSIDLEVGKAA